MVVCAVACNSGWTGSCWIPFSKSRMPRGIYANEMATSSTGEISCREADLASSADAQLLVELLNIYATDPMGGSSPLDDFVRENLAEELRKRPTAHAFFAFVDGVPAGLSICFEGFSTFECKPLINIHDMVVVPDFRRRGVCSALLACIEEFARSIGCCKVTLEVLEGNHVAKSPYIKAGFGPYMLNPEAGCAQFWQKKLH